MLEELQAAWDRPGEVFFNPQYEDGGWAMGWKITRPVKMWLGKTESHQYGAYTYDKGEPDPEVVFEALDLLRVQFDLTMQVLGWPAWRRFLLKLPFRLRWRWTKMSCMGDS